MQMLNINSNIDIELLKNITDYGILGILAFMGFLSLWFYIERLIFLARVDVKKYSNKQSLEIDITNHTTIISSIASNAVYIGLLGTVFGIIITFYSMGQTGDIDVKIIMSSLSFALKATALGLIIAIPAMFFYNHLVRLMEVKLALWDIKNNDN
jgi:biopolymer transport protein ExbB